MLVTVAAFGVGGVGIVFGVDFVVCVFMGCVVVFVVLSLGCSFNVCALLSLL